MRRLARFVMALGLAAASAAAGPNASASLWVDAIPATPAVDSAASAGVGGTFRIAVRIAGARYLDSYSFEVAFDTALVAFTSAEADRPGEGLVNLLSTRGGTPAVFIGRLSSRDPARVAAAYALAGSDSAQAPSGDGLLAVLEFQPKAMGAARFAIAAPRLLDWQGVEDSAVAAHGAAVTLAAVSASLRTASAPARFAAPSLDVLGRRFRLNAPGR